MTNKKKIENLIKYIIKELFEVITEEDVCYQGHGFEYNDFINRHYKSVQGRIKRIKEV